MGALSFILCIAIIVGTAFLLYRKYNPQAVLIFSGLSMVALAASIGISPVEVSKPTGTSIFDLIQIIEERFISNFTRAGLMIMVIGGYVAFMNKIQATNALVHIAIKPLAFFKKYPYIASIAAIPIGQLLFMTTPSAAGIGLLLVASVYPILVNLGVSKLTALSVISAATLFDQGPGSANTALASQLVDMGAIEYFLKHQLPNVVPTTVILMAVFYWNNKRCDKRDIAKGKQIFSEPMDENQKLEVPKCFALLPLLPLLLLIIFSDYIGLFHVKLSTTVAMLISFIFSVICIIVYKRNIKEVFSLIGSFWQGMGNVFATVITLIVAAEIFSGGLISLGFIDSLVSGTTTLGFSGIAISVLITAIVFLAAMLMGSGNAAFFSFGPLMPGIAAKLGMPAVQMILPMQLAASMGRATSPIAGVIVAIAGVAGVSPMDLAKRNLLPLIVGISSLTIIHFVFGI
ncbi:MAG: C4-dicarboxylate transporter DcuC [Bacteroidales bacterium]|nr:C4-dicarboxylate transporter DcuC [Bacteroidales bacterium]MDD4670449.1 C4-dicarboxylate transporter DcuC [Bacteroidales bacterium]